jgi:hypothetical protein
LGQANEYLSGITYSVNNWAFWKSVNVPSRARLSLFVQHIWRVFTEMTLREEMVWVLQSKIDPAQEIRCQVDEIWTSKRIGPAVRSRAVNARLCPIEVTIFG